jgi:type IV pilus assembly protein PilQ
MNKQAKPTQRLWWWLPRVGSVAAILMLLWLVGRADAQQTSTTKPVAEPAEAAVDEETAKEKAVQVDSRGRFDLHIQDVDIRMVLRQLSVQSRRNIVASPGVTGTVTADLYGVTFDRALEAVLHAANLAFVQRDNVIYVYTQEEYSKLDKKMVVEVFHLAYLTATDAKELIKDLLSTEGKVTITPAEHVGLEPFTGTRRTTHVAGEMIVVRDYKQNVEDVRKALAKLDIRPEQVLIETTILSVELDDNEDMGVDIAALAGTSFNAAGATSSLDSSPVLPANPPGFITNQADRSFSSTQARIGTNFAAGVPAGGLSFGIVTDNISFFVRALEEIHDTTILANPKLLVVNKQRGEVMIGNSYGYIASTTQTETSETSTVEFLETGTRLVLRPFVGKDEYIRMEIHPEISTGDVTVPAGSTTALPNKDTTEITTNVIVRDGRTIVIGGLFQETSDRHRRQVPVVGSIPGFGELFRNTNDQYTRRELIILITPHLVRYPKDEEISKRIKEDTERFRLGARHGLVGWSRVRLADSLMRRARRHLADGNVDKALWNTNLALAFSPCKDDAIYLRDKLNPRASWYNPPAHVSTRNVVERMILRDVKLPERRNMPHHTAKTTPAGGMRIVPLDKPDTDKPTATPRKKTVKNKPTPKPKPKPKPKPAPKLKPAPRPEPTTKPAPAPEPEPTTKPAPKPEPTTKPAPAPEPEPTTKPVPAPEPEPTTKPAPASQPAKVDRDNYFLIEEDSDVTEAAPSSSPKENSFSIDETDTP